MIKKLTNFINRIFLVGGIFLIIASVGGLLSGDILYALIVMAFGSFLVLKARKIHPNNKKIKQTKVTDSSDLHPVSTGTTRTITTSNVNTIDWDEYDYIKSTQLESDVTVFDFETTGLNSKEHEIIQVGAIKYRNEKIIDSYESLIKPSSPISPKITKLTGITNEMVVDAPLPKDLLTDLHNFIRGETLVAHNAPFDMRFLLEKSKQHQITHEKFKVIDTLRLSREYIHSTSNHKLATLKKYLKVDALSHNSIEDCRVTGVLYYHCKNIVDSKPGYHNGKHYTEYVENIKEMKRANLNVEAINLLLNLVDEVEAESKANNHSPAPWYYEQLAILYRKEKRNNDEISILNRYFDFCEQYSIPNGAKHQVLVDRYQKLIA